MENELNKKINIDISKNTIEEIIIEDISNNLQTDLSKNELVDLSNSKIKDSITCLCFSGGGIKGLSFIGALIKMIQEDYLDLDNIDTFCGTSIGSMIAFLLNIGLTTNEIKEFVLAFNFSKLNGEIDCINFFENYGINNGDRIKLIFTKFIERKFEKKDITFKELYDITKKKLIIVGTNLTEGKEVVFNIDTTPDFSVIMAIRISMSVPVIFTPVKLDGIVYVDGAIVNNFPINHCPEFKTLGFYVKNSKKSEVNSIQDVVTLCLGIACDNISEKSIIDIRFLNPTECWNKYKKLIVKIENPNFEYTKFDLTYEYKNSLIELGTKTIEKFIENLDLNVMNFE